MQRWQIERWHAAETSYGKACDCGEARLEHYASGRRLAVLRYGRKRRPHTVSSPSPENRISSLTIRLIPNHSAGTEYGWLIEAVACLRAAPQVLLCHTNITLYICVRKVMSNAHSVVQPPALIFKKNDWQESVQPTKENMASKHVLSK